MRNGEEQRAAQVLAREIARHAATISRTVRIMEVCGTHTMAIHEAGLKSVLPQNLLLVSGPGVPGMRDGEELHRPGHSHR